MSERRNELRRHPDAALWECSRCGQFYSYAGPGPEPACPYCAVREALEPIRELLRNVSRDRYPIYAAVWDAGRDALDRLEHVTPSPKASTP